MADPFAPSREHLLDLLVSRLSDLVIILLNCEGNFISWHPAVEAQLGYTEREFIGHSGEILMPLAERLKGKFRHELRTAASAGRASDTNWLLTKSGRPIFVEGVSLALRDPATGELLGYGKILRDVTERKQTEDALKTLTRALDQSVVFIQNREGVIEYWTSGCERLYGWSGPEAIGRVADDLLQTIYPNAGGMWEQLLNDGTWQGELEQKRRDGTPVFVSANCAVLSDGEGQQSTIISTHTDISFRLEIQRELEEANERLKTMALELERSNAELEEFARIASHDLNAPIISARWLVELLSARHGKKLDQDGQNYLQQISIGLERMTDLVEAILAHARVGKERIGAAKPTSADQALNIAIGNLQKDLNTSQASIVRQPLPYLLIEPQPLAQLFQNLLSNAIKYRRSNVPLRIEINAAYISNQWQLSVRDNGIGLETSWYERVFQPMQRRHGTDIAGSGIGLATCKKIVTRAGGRIWVESEVGVGSTFFFTLPGTDPSEP